VRVELVRSERTSVCPYKGTATWWHARHADRIIEDIAWSYESPIAETRASADSSASAMSVSTSPSTDNDRNSSHALVLRPLTPNP
jgi:uncharacterized protein (DUF427 family)